MALEKLFIWAKFYNRLVKRLIENTDIVPDQWMTHHLSAYASQAADKYIRLYQIGE